MPATLKHLIEAARECAILIPNQQANRFRAFGERPPDLKYLLRDHRPSGSAVMPGDQPTMPFEQRGRLDEEHCPERAWQQRTGGGREDPIRHREWPPRNLSAQDRRGVAGQSPTP